MIQRYIADWHYGHQNILHYDNRRFVDVDEMNSELIKRWNDVVQQDDVTYVLGDMFWCKTMEAVGVLEQLNGKKILIAGNHDNYEDKAFASHFEKIENYMEIEDGSHEVILCHYPIPCFKSHYYGSYHLYGHVHRSFEYSMMEHDKMLMRDLYTKPCNMYNVGAMMPYMDYTPRTLDEIIKGSAVLNV